MTKVQFKFREDTSGDDRHELIAKLEENGADRVERLFPDAKDDELGTLYRAMIEDDSSGKVLRMLKRSRKVEFAEPEPRRRLIRPA